MKSVIALWMCGKQSHKPCSTRRNRFDRPGACFGLLRALACHQHKRLSCRYTSGVSDKIVQRLRLSAWGRVFRRLLRSAALTDAQKTVIWTRQIALGIRSSARAHSSGHRRHSSSELEQASLSTPSRPLDSRVKPVTTPFSAAVSSVPTAIGSPGYGLSLSFGEGTQEADAVKYESDESGDEHRPEPSSELIVSV